MPRQGRRECADCGHDVSTHKFGPSDPVKNLPADSVPGECCLCDCPKYRKPNRGERIINKPVTKIGRRS